MNVTYFLGEYFHFPDRRISKSKPYMRRRQDVTIQYGNLLAVVLVVIVVSIPIFNCLRANRYWFPNRIHILRSTNNVLSKLRRRSLISERLALRIRTFASTVYLNYGTAFQICLWVSVFTVLSFAKICDGDLIFLTKRLGRLCVVSLPTVFFLTLRPSPLPQTLYLSLLPIHKWLSRMVVLLAVLHTVIYLAYMFWNNTVAKAYRPANLFGWTALCGFIFIVITSLPRIRDRAYKVFFFNHYFWSWVVVLCLPFHVRPVNTTYANAANVFLLSYQVFNRIRLSLRPSLKGDLKVFDVSPNMAVVEFPNSWLTEKAINPGAHIRITNWHPNIIVRLYKLLVPNYHPYTLVTLPLDRYQRLIVRKGAFQWDNNRRYLCYGTFDPKLLFIQSCNTSNSKFSLSRLSIEAKKLLIVVGGSAISFAIPVLRAANYHGIPTKIVWVLRDYKDIAILKCFEGLFNGDEFEIFVTGGSGCSSTQSVVNAFSITERKSSSPLINYNTFASYTGRDLEQNEESILTSSDTDDTSKDFENVDVDFIETEDDRGIEECQNTFTIDNILPDTSSIRSDDLQELQFDGAVERRVSMNNLLSGSVSRKSSTSGFNDQFVPNLDSNNLLDNEYLRTVQNLHLEHRIYSGRPVLNFRYYNWCLAANDTFTQCSGPVMDEESNLVCCKDLPGRQHIMENGQKTSDLSKVWVISAGPKSLVKNTRLWANENGLKYHEEAFYV